MTHAFHLPTGWEDPTTWVLIALVLFFVLMVFLKVPGMAAKALDGRAAAIAAELDDAKRLREEAQELLASFQRRQREAEEEAEAIVEQAHRDAQRFAEEARAKMTEQLERRAQLAERKIAQAETDAAAQVRAQAADLAIAAAERLLAERLDANAQAKLVDEGVSELKSRFS